MKGGTLRSTRLYSGCYDLSGDYYDNSPYKSPISLRYGSFTGSKTPYVTDRLESPFRGTTTARMAQTTIGV